jgi:hypothetical protein
MHNLLETVLLLISKLFVLTASSLVFMHVGWLDRVEGSERKSTFTQDSLVECQRYRRRCHDFSYS